MSFGTCNTQSSASARAIIVEFENRNVISLSVLNTHDDRVAA